MGNCFSSKQEKEDMPDVPKCVRDEFLKYSGGSNVITSKQLLKFFQETQKDKVLMTFPFRAVLKESSCCRMQILSPTSDVNAVCPLRLHVHLHLICHFGAPEKIISCGVHACLSSSEEPMFQPAQTRILKGNAALSACLKASDFSELPPGRLCFAGPLPICCWPFRAPAS